MVGVYEFLKSRNYRIPFYSVHDPEFTEYGKVIKDYDFYSLVEKAQGVPMPEEGSKYELNLGSLREDGDSDIIYREIFGEAPIQAGLCWGYNEFLNGLEYHKSSELNIAATHMVLILGKVSEIDEEAGFDSSKAKAFFVNRGEAVELFATTLHFCPCQTDADGFRCIVVLPVGTNAPLDNKPEDKRLFRKNKWLICHNGNEALIAKGVSPEIHGRNIKIEY